MDQARAAGEAPAVALDALEHEPRYLGIEEYALVGDTRGAALVGRDGRVDWCALGRFDADPVCCRLLDADRGGFLSVRPPVPCTSQRRYLPKTAVLETVLQTSTGTVRLLDFMPVGRNPAASAHDYVRLEAPGWFVRVIEGLAGRMRLRVRCRSTRDHGRDVLDVPPETTVPLVAEGEGLWSGELDVLPGQRHRVVLGHEGRGLVEGGAERLLRITRAFWEEWSEYCAYGGPYREAVLRSAITLKLLTDSRTGAIVAAPTTSLPERPGGSESWDARYCPIPGAAPTLYTLDVLGYPGEARAFARFLRRLAGTEPERIQALYRVDGRPAPPARELLELEGWRGHRPVRVGDRAGRGVPVDALGDLLDCAWLDAGMGIRPGEDLRRELARVADYAAASWQPADAGIEAAHEPPLQRVQGEVQAWIVLDRACRLLGEQRAWREARGAVEAAIRERGVDPATGSLKRSFDDPRPEAPLLLVRCSGLPLPAGTLAATVEQAERQLRRGDLLFPQAARREDEAALVAASFWLVSALVEVGRADEARQLFERMARRANDVGLYSARLDADDGGFLGNFPQGSSHVALLTAAVDLELFDRYGPEGPRGTHLGRLRRVARPARGFGSVLARLERSWRTGRVRSSRRSVLDPSSLR